MSTSAAPEPSAESRPAGAYSGKAVVGLACALVALLSPAPFNLLAAVIAVIAADLSRRELRADSTLRGAGASLIAFLLGAAILLFGLIPALAAVLSFLR